jgi:hypothetical protein
MNAADSKRGDVKSARGEANAREVQMMTTRDFDFELVDTTAALAGFFFNSRNPNMLIVATEKAREGVTEQMAASCRPPVHMCRVPGPLYLPAACGTLVISDLAMLEMNQQLALYDWISRHHPSRVLSITSADVPALIQDGLFLAGLYYRLNTVRIDARAQLSPVGALAELGRPKLWS